MTIYDYLKIFQNLARALQSIICIVSDACHMCVTSKTLFFQHKCFQYGACKHNDSNGSHMGCTCRMQSIKLPVIAIR